MGPGLRIQPKASQKKVQAKSSVAWKWWTHPETLALIDVWGEAMEEHCKTYKGKRILPSSAYEKITEKLSETGVRRSVEQIREKIKTLKKSFWGALAKNNGSAAGGRMNGKRQSVIEKMRRVLQANGNMVKGKYTWKSEPHNSDQVKSRSSRGKEQRKSKRVRKVFPEVMEEQDDEAEDGGDEEEDEEDEDDEENESQMDMVATQELNGDEELEMGITVDPGHVHNQSDQWADINGGCHMGNDINNEGGGGNGGSTSSGGCGEISYNYPLCQVIENMMNKFLSAQRESEERFLMLEEQRMKAENKRWETMQKKDADVVNKLLQTHDRWRKEDREQELRIWAALVSKVGGATHQRANSKSDITPEITQLMMAASPPFQWQFTGTFRPSVATDTVPSSSSSNN